ncbi:glutathione S-transferase [uncultured Pseudoteredinibacter sp.]|uniref:glutathione S-transferase n=1 Tax=uncultured Pseudoteredinibacter sp. TaxID=1641701 RepID=UPI00262829BB|nr:glutathione S-transferase [uncultured Pseudoteredinibacter sp.]
MQLTVGTDSTWSLRAWICTQIAGIEVDISVIDLASTGYKVKIQQHSKAGQVPFLIDGSVEAAGKQALIYDSLAIAEYLNERSEGALLPIDISDRALARSLCAELHSGFMALRSNCPFSLQAVGPLSEINSDIEKELDRLVQIFENAEGPFMFGSATMVDAFYAILAFRLAHYGLKLEGKAGVYQQSLLQWDLLKAAIEKAEQWNQQAKQAS